MIVTMHQPEHLPWLGFFHKMALADFYIIMDTVQYRRQYFQNRNRIRGVHAPIWVNVPVRKQAHRYGRIADVCIDNSRDWRKTYWGSVRYHYSSHPFFSTYAPDLHEILFAPFESLIDLNLVLIDFFREAFAISTPIIKCSQLGVAGQHTELIHRVAREIGATTYLSGPTGREYLDETPFRLDGINVAYHDFKHPRYPQHRRTSFTSCLSALDLLMNCGPESAELLRNMVLASAPPAPPAPLPRQLVIG